MTGEESSPIEVRGTQVGIASVLQKVFFLMTGGLIITGITSLLILNMESLLIFALNTFYIWLIAELAVVIILSSRIEKMGTGADMLAFVLYAIINGITLTPIFLVYTGSSIATVFFITAVMFAGAALIGKITKMDLSKAGSFFMMALLGLIIAGIIDIFIFNDMYSFIIAAIGVVIFVALTAYDVQKIMRYSEMIGSENEENSKKLVIMGALTLYLDFINIFLKLLRLMGKRRK